MFRHCPCLIRRIRSADHFARYHGGGGRGSVRTNSWRIQAKLWRCGRSSAPLRKYVSATDLLFHEDVVDSTHLVWPKVSSLCPPSLLFRSACPEYGRRALPSRAIMIPPRPGMCEAGVIVADQRFTICWIQNGAHRDSPRSATCIGKFMPIITLVFVSSPMW